MYLINFNVVEMWNIYLFVVVEVDALAQGSDFRIERRQLVFLCWMRDSNPGSLGTNLLQTEPRWQTDWAIVDQARKLELKSPSLWSVIGYVRCVWNKRQLIYFAFEFNSADTIHCVVVFSIPKLFSSFQHEYISVVDSKVINHTVNIDLSYISKCLSA